MFLNKNVSINYMSKSTPTPPLIFNVNNYEFNFFKNATHITGFNLVTGELSSPFQSWGGNSYTLYSFFGTGFSTGQFDSENSVSDLISRGVNLGTQTLTGDSSATWEKLDLNFNYSTKEYDSFILYFIMDGTTEVGLISKFPSQGWNNINTDIAFTNSEPFNGYIYFYGSKNYDPLYGELNGSEGSYSLNNNMGINCLTKGTKILTPNGYVKVEDLKKGDIILNSKKEEKAIKEMLYQKARIIKGENHLNEKFLLKKDSLGENLPSEDLIVSGGHMIKVGDDFHLPRNSDLFENIHEEVELVEYYNIELDDYDFIISHGVEIESLCRAENHKEKEKYFEERGIDYWKFVKPK